MKTTLLFSLLMLGFTFISCEDDSYGSCGDTFPHFEIKGISSLNMRFTNSEQDIWETIKKSDSANWERFAAKFTFNVDYISSVIVSGSSLMALSCIPNGYYGDKVGVDTIIVKTVNDYNQTYPAGSVINDILLTNSAAYAVTDFEEFDVMTKYLSENEKSVQYESFALRLTQEPSTDGAFSLDVTYRLNNGEVLTHRTEAVTLMK